MFYLEREITCSFLSGFSSLSWIGGYFILSIVLGWYEDLCPLAYVIKLIVKLYEAWGG